MSNMENPNKEIQVSLKGIPGNADTSPVVSLIFSTMCFVCFAWIMGWLGDGSTFAVGVMQLSVFVTYVIGGHNMITMGAGFPGNMYLIFATFFGGVAGFANVAGSLAAAHGIPFSMAAMGWGFLISGIFLLCMIPFLLPRAGKVDVLVTFFGGFGVLLFGLTGVGVGPLVLNTVGAYSLLGCGIVGLYSAVVAMVRFMGIELTFGSKPFISPKQ